MSGHSKWNNIKHKKEKSDAQKAKVFTKIGKEIAIAVRESGADPSINGKLRDLIAKAKSNNVPNDNIDRIIKKAAGDDSIVYEEVTYEGYGPSGIAVIVECTTDNRNRTGGDIRHFFDKYGGNLGAQGCVSYMFEEKGVIIIAKEHDEGKKTITVDEDKLMEDALEAGASDFVASDEVFEIYTEADDLYAVRDELEKDGYVVESAEKDKLPNNYITLDNEDSIKMMNLLLEHLDDCDDVSEVYHNWENEDDE